MVYRAAVIALLGTLLVLHVGQEMREIHRDVHIESHLRDLARQPNAKPQPAPTSAADPSAPGVVVVDASRPALERMLDADDTFGPTRVVPLLKRGTMIGFKVYGVRPATLLGTLGLQNGDTLLAVNDVPVTDTPTLIESLAWDRTPDFLDLSIRRDGGPVRIVVLLHG